MLQFTATAITRAEVEVDSWAPLSADVTSRRNSCALNAANITKSFIKIHDDVFQTFLIK